MIGRTLLEFRIEKQLAQGGMGAVYLARHVRLPRTLKVIKVLLPAYAGSDVLRQRFHREAEAASRLDHERILGIDNFGELPDGQLFIMVPYLEGQPLDAYLRARGGRLAPHRVLHLVVQLCDALDHAHALGIIHRDLKPGNVYVVATNANPYALKLLDFGIAKIIGEGASDPVTYSGVAIGTPSYMAVEQYEHADEVTHLADIYSLAIVIWELVTGRLPWQHPDHAALYHLQRTVIPARPPADVMPPAWTDVLLEALSVEPAERPRSARELAVTLASALPAVEGLPSGAEILADLAPHFVQKAASDLETVRNAAEVNRIGPLLWPVRETAPGSPRGVAASAARRGVVAADAPREAPAVAAGAPGAAANPTTFSAATGVASGPGESRGGRRAPRWRVALAAAGAAALAALATGAIAARATSDGASPAPRAEPAKAASVAAPPRADSPVPAAASQPPAAASVPAPAAAATPAAAAPAAAAPIATAAAAAAPTAAAAPAAAPIATADPAAAPAAAATSTPARPSDAHEKPRTPRTPLVPPRARDAASGVRPPTRKKSIDPDDVSGPEE